VAEYILKIGLPSKTINFPTHHIYRANRRKIDYLPHHLRAHSNV